MAPSKADSRFIRQAGSPMGTISAIRPSIV
jgi:hypothetical protein